MATTSELPFIRESTDNPGLSAQDHELLTERSERDFRDRLRTERRESPGRVHLAAADRLTDKGLAWAREHIPDLDVDLKEIDRERNERMAQVFDQEWPVVPLDDRDGDPFAPRVAGWGEFWWARSEWHWHSPLGVEPRANGLHFFGRLDYKGDPLLRISTGVVGHFGLSADRRPPAPSGRYRSATAVSLLGRVGGFTGLYHPIWAADDKWCKCWLVLRQTAWQFAHNTTWVQLDEKFAVQNLFDLANVYGVGQAGHTFNGFRPAPALEFGLADPAATIWVQSEVRLDFQLEGDATIGLSPGPNADDSVVVDQPQWLITPL